jgi:hypothetical protein
VDRLDTHNTFLGLVQGGELRQYRIIGIRHLGRRSGLPLGGSECKGEDFSLAEEGLV